MYYNFNASINHKFHLTRIYASSQITSSSFSVIPTFLHLMSYYTPTTRQTRNYRHKTIISTAIIEASEPQYLFTAWREITQFQNDNDIVITSDILNSRYTLQCSVSPSVALQSLGEGLHEAKGVVSSLNQLWWYDLSKKKYLVLYTADYDNTILQSIRAYAQVHFRLIPWLR